MKDDQVTRMAQMLKAAVRFTGVSHRQIEREMGLSTGYLSRILSGKVELRMQHVLGICKAIGLPAGAFFEAAFPRRDYDRQTERLVAALQELMPEPEDAEVPRRPKTRKAVQPPPPPERRSGKRAPRQAARSQFRHLLEALLIQMQQMEDEAEEA